MSTPTREADRLQLEEVDRLRDVAEGLVVDRDADGVVYTSRRSRDAAGAFVAALQEEPVQALRELSEALRRARIDLREDGRRGGVADDG